MRLKGKFRKLVLVTVSISLGWYSLYAVASAFARGLMRHRLVGTIDVALVSGLSQFAVTFVLAWCCVRYSREILDPLADQIAADAEDGGPAGTYPNGAAR